MSLGWMSWCHLLTIPLVQEATWEEGYQKLKEKCRDTQDNDTQQNNIQQRNSIQHNHIQYNGIQRKIKNATLSIMTHSLLAFNAYTKCCYIKCRLGLLSQLFHYVECRYSKFSGAQGKKNVKNVFLIPKKLLRFVKMSPVKVISSSQQ